MRRSAPTIVLEPRASRCAVLVHALAALSLVGVSLYLGYGVGAVIAFTLIGAAAVAQVAMVERARARVRLVLQPDGAWHWREGDGGADAALIDYADLGAWIGLSFRLSSGRVRRLAVWPDSLPQDARHALAVWLRGRRHEPVHPRFVDTLRH